MSNALVCYPRAPIRNYSNYNINLPCPWFDEKINLISHPGQQHRWASLCLPKPQKFSLACYSVILRLVSSLSPFSNTALLRPAPVCHVELPIRDSVAGIKTFPPAGLYTTPESLIPPITRSGVQGLMSRLRGASVPLISSPPR